MPKKSASNFANKNQEVLYKRRKQMWLEHFHGGPEPGNFVVWLAAQPESAKVTAEQAEWVRENSRRGAEAVFSKW